MNTDCTMLHFAVILSSKFMPFLGGCFIMLQDLGCQCMHLQSADVYPQYVCYIYTFLSCTYIMKMETVKLAVLAALSACGCMF